MVEIARLPMGRLARYGNDTSPIIASNLSYKNYKVGPSVVVVRNGTHYCLYESINQGTPPANTTTSLATSSDGRTWTDYGSNPVMTPTVAWELADTNYPETTASALIYDSDAGLWKMWYHGGGNTTGTRKIGYATSSDLITWTKYASNPVLDKGAAASWEENGVADPKVVKIGSTYHMIYTGRNNANTARLGYATSSNGTTWVKYGSNPVFSAGSASFENANVGGPALVYDSATGIVHMWYSGFGSTYTDSAIGYAWSTDFINWTRGQNNPVLSRSGDMDSVSDTTEAYRVGNKIFVHFTGTNPTASLEDRFLAEIGMSTTNPVNMITHATFPDSSGNCYPAKFTASNNAWRGNCWVFKNSGSSQIALHGRFQVPPGYVGSGIFKLFWTSSATSGNVVWKVYYRTVGSDNSESYDQATEEEAPSNTDAAPGAAYRQLIISLSPTSANFAAEDIVEFRIVRDKSSGSDTMAADALLMEAKFYWSDAA